MSANAFSNNLYQLQQTLQQANQTVKNSSFVKQSTSIGRSIQANVQQVWKDKDPGEAMLLTSKLGMGISLLFPTSIVSTYGKWSLATGYAMCLDQGRKLGSYYETIVKYPDKLEQYWEEKTKESSLTGRILMAVPQHFSTFSVRITAAALETLVGVVSAVAKSTKSVVHEELSKRIQNASKKEHAILAAQVIGISIVALPTLYYFSNTVIYGLRTIGSATMTAYALKTLKDKSVEALKVDYNGYGKTLETHYDRLKKTANTQNNKLQAWLSNGSKVQKTAKKVLLASGCVIGACSLGVGLYFASPLIKVGFSLSKASLKVLRFLPHAMASYEFFKIAFPTQESSKAPIEEVPAE